MSITRDTIEAEIIDRIKSKLSDVLLDDPDRDAKIATMNRIVSEAVRAVRTNDELKEAVKRFWRTDEAADNLVAYILSWHQSQVDQAVREAKVEVANKYLAYRATSDTEAEAIAWLDNQRDEILDFLAKLTNPRDKEQS